MAGDQQQDIDRILAALRGATLAGVEAWEHGWAFGFSSGATVTTQSIWRALTTKGIAVASEDHEQRFGSPQPVDAGQRAAGVLLGKITKVELAPGTSDLRIEFSSQVTLEFLNTSSGYEGWHLVALGKDRKTRELIALGGGGLARWPSD